LRRLEGVLEDSKEAVLAQLEKVQAMNLPEEAQEKLLIRATEGLSFFISHKWIFPSCVKPVLLLIWKRIFKAFQKMPVRFLNTLNSLNLLASLTMPICFTKSSKRFGKLI